MQISKHAVISKSESFLGAALLGLSIYKIENINKPKLVVLYIFEHILYFASIPFIRLVKTPNRSEYFFSRTRPDNVVRLFTSYENSR